MPLLPVTLPDTPLPDGLHPVLSAEAMREADRVTIEDIGLPGFTLMESASRGAAARIAERYGPMEGLRVTCLCGKGNNGGDGLAVARLLHARGASVRVVAMSGPEAMSEDAAHNWSLLTTLAEHEADNGLSLHRFDGLPQLAAFPTPDLYVDALLGTGLTSDLRQPIARLVPWLNDQPAPTVALDVPTGLHTDLGVPLGDAVVADATVTMAALKTGLLLNDGPEYAGDVDVVDIGIPAFVLKRVCRTYDGCGWWPTDATARAWWPRRARDAYKYSAGLALVVGGAPGMTGAPSMAALAAARIGAGYVQCACHEAIAPTLATQLTTIPSLALPGHPDGGIAPEAGLDVLRDRLNQAQALLVGPGLGRHPNTEAFVLRLLRHTDLPLVIDADGLNALADAPEVLQNHAQGRWILTPHAGEFKRLAGPAVDLQDRLRTAQEYAERWNSVLLLKGTPSLVATPDGTVYVNGTGNAAAATAGTGDVLAGLCVGLLAQGLLPERAAVTALHLGGLAADAYAATHHPSSMIATDLLDLVPDVLHDLGFPTSS
ncbi:MAG: NAD(P)H-hydrate dehydratase [Bacteroidetes bacterium]|jgi:NAD(P)H-hydrate epimerase|nr:NAD(P)H-hydrate dehydratase [Bacteroidota bacterium]